MLHDWNFKVKNPVFEYGGLQFLAELFTASNRYDLDEDRCVTKTEDGVFRLDCDGLTWAGGQEKAEGRFSLTLCKNGGRYVFKCAAEHTEHILRVKIKLYGQPEGRIVARRRYDEQVSEEGAIFRYPNGWDDLFTPLVTIVHDGGVRFYRSLDKKVRPKTFYIRKQGDVCVEMIFEEDARRTSAKIDVPEWEVGDCATTDEIFKEQCAYVSQVYGLETWDARKDIPDWARNISLVVSLHGMHWSGYIFNTYAQMIEKLRWFAERIDPNKVLVYIPGFDGRYYFKYSDYTPDERMGGSKGLRALMDYAHGVGYHIMPMFMINGANPDTPGFQFWGEPSRYRGPNNYPLGVGSCDWDTSRGYNLGCGVGLNPGAPLWQDRLVEELEKQISEFDMDAIFLDLAAIYHNDPMFSTVEGSERIAARLHEKFPHLLIGTEGWYDALGKFFPFSQCAGNGCNGEMIWHDTPYAPFYDEYHRYFGHLCLGDPASHRNGVFEWGINPSPTRLPLRKGLIPTVTVLEDTLDKAPEKVEEVIADSEEYRKKFIK